MVVINGFDRSGHAPIMLPSYLFLSVIQLRQSLSHFTRNTLIEAAIYFQVIPTHQPTSVVGNITIDLIDYVPGIGNWSVIDFHSMSRSYVCM